jgi:hypothetical protein
MQWVGQLSVRVSVCVYVIGARNMLACTCTAASSVNSCYVILGNRRHISVRLTRRLGLASPHHLTALHAIAAVVVLQAAA